jgi:hypothetical protein
MVEVARWSVPPQPCPLWSLRVRAFPLPVNGNGLHHPTKRHGESSQTNAEQLPRPIELPSMVGRLNESMHRGTRRRLRCYRGSLSSTFAFFPFRGPIPELPGCQIATGAHRRIQSSGKCCVPTHLARLQTTIWLKTENSWFCARSRRWREFARPILLHVTLVWVYGWAQFRARA